MANSERQILEIEVLKSIYTSEEELCIYDLKSGLIGITFYAFVDVPEKFIIDFSNDKQPIASGSKLDVDISPKCRSLEIQYLPPIELTGELPLDYPSNSAPKYQLSCSWLSLEMLKKLCLKMDEIWDDNKFSEILFIWTSFLKDESLQFLEINNSVRIDVAYFKTDKYLNKKLEPKGDVKQCVTDSNEINLKEIVENNVDSLNKDNVSDITERIQCLGEGSCKNDTDRNTKIIDSNNHQGVSSSNSVNQMNSRGKGNGKKMFPPRLFYNSKSPNQSSGYDNSYGYGRRRFNKYSRNRQKSTSNFVEDYSNDKGSTSSDNDHRSVKDNAGRNFNEGNINSNYQSKGYHRNYRFNKSTPYNDNNRSNYHRTNRNVRDKNYATKLDIAKKLTTNVCESQESHPDKSSDLNVPCQVTEPCTDLENNLIIDNKSVVSSVNYKCAIKNNLSKTSVSNNESTCDNVNDISISNHSKLEGGESSRLIFQENDVNFKSTEKVNPHISDFKSNSSVCKLETNSFCNEENLSCTESSLLENLSIDKDERIGKTLSHYYFDNFIKYLEEYNTDRMLSIFRKGYYDCSICYEVKRGVQCIQFNPCKHTFCKDCIGKFIQGKIDDGSVYVLKCPEVKCDSDVLPAQVREVVSPEQFAKYDSLLLTTTLQTMEDITYCPRSSCQYPVSREQDEKMATCPSCSYVFCVFCRMVYHGVEPCRFRNFEKAELVKKYIESSPEDKLAMERRFGKKQLEQLVQSSLSETWISDNSLNCPHCNASIEKNGGCNKMVCWRCSTYFCWICQVRLDPNSPYVHYNDRKSKCYRKLFQGVDLSDNDEPEDDIDDNLIFVEFLDDDDDND